MCVFRVVALLLAIMAIIVIMALIANQWHGFSSIIDSECQFLKLWILSLNSHRFHTGVIQLYMGRERKSQDITFKMLFSWS